jgi:hypothetical protein
MGLPDQGIAVERGAGAYAVLSKGGNDEQRGLGPARHE